MDVDDYLLDTYIAALQHDLVALPEEATLVGVVRRPPRWFNSVVDENHSSLGPPPELLDEFKQRHEEFKMQGMCDEGAHNAAWEALSFADRYREYLETDNRAQRDASSLVERLQSEEQLVLVCFENTNQKRCHRTILRDYLVE
jgi:uncharacterized protein YeaO (DUF488 family)